MEHKRRTGFSLADNVGNIDLMTGTVTMAHGPIIHVSAATKLKDRSGLSAVRFELGDMGTGDRVAVKGHLTPDGRLVAVKLTREHASECGEQTTFARLLN